MMCDWTDISLSSFRMVLITVTKWRKPQRRNTRMEMVCSYKEITVFREILFKKSLHFLLCCFSFDSLMLLKPCVALSSKFHLDKMHFSMNLVLIALKVKDVFSEVTNCLYRESRGGAPCWGDWCTACEACSWRGGGGLSPGLKYTIIIHGFVDESVNFDLC